MKYFACRNSKAMLNLNTFQEIEYWKVIEIPSIEIKTKVSNNKDSSLLSIEN